MKKFRFRLENVLGYRKRLEELAEQEFQAAQSRLEVARHKLKLLQDDFQVTLAARPGCTPGERFDPVSLFDRERYLQTLQAAAEAQIRRVQAVEMLVFEKRQVLVAARQAHQAVERLKEQELARYTQLLQRHEQEALDELAGMRHSARRAAEETA